MVSASKSRLCISPSVAITTVMPFVRGINSSIIETSNVIAASARATDDLSVNPSVSWFFGFAFTKFDKFPCSIITPLGFPVEPDV